MKASIRQVFPEYGVAREQTFPCILKPRRPCFLTFNWNDFEAFSLPAAAALQHANEEDWNEVLLQMIAAFREVPDVTTYHLAIMELVASGWKIAFYQARQDSICQS